MIGVHHFRKLKWGKILQKKKTDIKSIIQEDSNIPKKDENGS
jgi:hypothetical protein